MKLILSPLITVFLVFACGNKFPPEKGKTVDTILYTQTAQHFQKDTAKPTIIYKDTCLPKPVQVQQVVDTRKLDSLQRLLDSTRDELFVSNYKIRRVRYYLNIAIKNPKQDKWLKGWIKRAIN